MILTFVFIDRIQTFFSDFFSNRRPVTYSTFLKLEKLQEFSYFLSHNVMKTCENVTNTKTETRRMKITTTTGRFVEDLTSSFKMNLLLLDDGVKPADLMLLIRSLILK